MFSSILNVQIVLSLIASSLGEKKLIELNYDYGENTLTWPDEAMTRFKLTPIHEGFKDGLWYSAFNYEGTEHSGTHLDAPYHFAEHGYPVDQIPVENLIVPAVVMDIREKVKKDPMARLTADDVVNWVNKHGSMPNNSVVLVLTGWDKKSNNSNEYYGLSSSSDVKTFPGVDVGAAQTLLAYKTVSGVHIVGMGIDGPSIDVGSSKIYDTHRELMAQNVYVLENLRGLDKLPVTGANLIVMPMKIRGGSGAPCRVIATIESGSTSLHNSLTIVLVSAIIVLLV